MQYDLKKELSDKQTIALQWHGEDTKVLIAGDGVKTEVKTGDVITVSMKQARELFSYSNLWTFEGDKPVKHNFNEMLKKLAAKAAKKDKKSKTEESGDEEEEEEEEEEITADDVDNMKTKKEVVAALKNLGATFNDQATKAELSGLLKEVLAEKAQANTPANETEAKTEESGDQNAASDGAEK